jgi:hypothetical protein
MIIEKLSLQNYHCKMSLSNELFQHSYCSLIIAK